MLAQLQAVAAYPVSPVVRVPIGDVVTLKQVLDLGAQNILVPMVSSAEEAAQLVEAVRYPPRGRRGVGSALARSARWNRVDDYLANADEHVSLFVQVETVEGVEAAGTIAAVDGIDGVFVGPSDLAASMGLLGQQTHADVAAAVVRAFDAVLAAGKPVGVNAFDPAAAQSYVDAGAGFVLVGADVAVLARASESSRRAGSRHPTATALRTEIPPAATIPPHPGRGIRSVKSPHPAPARVRVRTCRGMSRAGSFSKSPSPPTWCSRSRWPTSTRRRRSTSPRRSTANPSTGTWSPTPTARVCTA
nr:hypothetical protein GCM10025699_01420 [Microbacterium flavescens]